MTEITIQEAKNMLHYLLNTNLKLVENGKRKIAIELQGACGIGKTDSILQIAEERKCEVIKISLSQIEEMGDLIGFPIKEYLLYNHEGNKEWISEKMVDYYINIGYSPCGENNHRMSYAIPQWVPKEEGKEIIILLDDFSRADGRLIQATMELIDRYNHLSWVLPKKSHIILTSNPDNGMYNVSSLDLAQRCRYITLNIKFDFNIWVKWAEKNDIDQIMINFCLAHPEIFDEPEKSGVSPKTFVLFALSISGISDFKSVDNLTMVRTLAAACFRANTDVIGDLFISFIHNNEILISVEDIIYKPWDTVKMDIYEVIHKGGDYRADNASVLATRLLDYCDNYFVNKNNKADVIINRILEILDYEGILFADDILFKIINHLLTKYPNKCQKLKNHIKVREIILS